MLVSIRALVRFPVPDLSSILAAGLKIAQTYGLHKKVDESGVFIEGERIPWRKNWRTLKFLERLASVCT